MMPWWANARAVLLGALVAILAASLVGAYHAGAGRERDRWQAKFLAAERAAARAVAERAEIEREAANRLRIAADAYNAEVDRRARAGAAVRGELDRLRGAIAASGGAGAADPAARPAVDAACAVTRELFGQCSERLARMGEEARGLAGTVIGLQGYANTAEATCGR